MGDVELLEELCEVIADTSLCGLGQTAPNAVLSTIRYFRDEYIEHIEDGICRAGICFTEHDKRAYPQRLRGRVL